MKYIVACNIKKPLDIQVGSIGRERMEEGEWEGGERAWHDAHFLSFRPVSFFVQH